MASQHSNQSVRLYPQRRQFVNEPSWFFGSLARKTKEALFTPACPLSSMHTINPLRWRRILNNSGVNTLRRAQ
jgi:hypothetical protein